MTPKTFCWCGVLVFSIAVAMPAVAEAQDVPLESLERFNVGVTADMDPGASGEMSFERYVPSMHVITSPEIKHTEQDTPEWIPAVGLEQVTRAYARIIDQVNGMSRAELQPARGSSEEEVRGP